MDTYQSKTENLIGSDLATPITAPLAGDPSSLANPLVPSTAVGFTYPNALDTQFSTSNFVVSSLSPQESVIYLNSIGIAPSSSNYAQNSLGTSTSSNNLTTLVSSDLTVGSMPNSLTFMGSNQSDKLYLKLGEQNTLDFSNDGINFNSTNWLSLSNIENIFVNLEGGDDNLFIDQSLFNFVSNSNTKINFDGGIGKNTLFGPAVDTTWHITGVNSGNLGNVLFQNTTDLNAAAYNYATFVFSNDGVLDGVADGGDGNLGTLIIDGGNYQTSRYIASGPHSGSILLDQKLIQYDGLAPIIDNTNTANRIFTATSGNDQIVVGKNTIGGVGEFIFINSTNNTFENVTYQFAPTGKLTIDAGGGDDNITVNWFDPNAGATLEILGGSGRDTVLFANSLNLNGGGLIVAAESISVASGVTLDTTKLGGSNGDIVFTATDSQDGILANGNAQVSLNGATLKAGNINISATSTVTGSMDNIAAIVALDSTAKVSLVDTRIESSGSVSIASSSIVTGSATAKGLSSQIDTSKDAAVAVLDVDSTATTNISGSSSISALGLLSVTATNKVTATSIGDASTAAAGAGIATNTISTITKAFIDSSSNLAITASKITLNADSENIVTTTAKSSAGGSTNNDQTPQNRTDNNAKNSDGAVTVAGALAFSKLSSVTEAFLAPSNAAIGATLTAASLDISATNKSSVSTTADGSFTSAGSTGVGVAVAINVSNVSTKAYIGSKVILNVGSTTIQALTPNINSFTAIATSGSGDAGKFGIAGAFAVNKLNNSSQSWLLAGSLVNGTNGSLFLISDNKTNSQTKAESAQSGGQTLGVGASFALAVENNTSEAIIQDNVTLSQIGAVSLTANSDNSNENTVQAGAAGGTAVSPAVAMAIVANDTLATIGNAGTSGLLAIGSLEAKANHKGKAVTTADATAAGGKVAVGAALALNFVNDKTIATTSRNINATTGGVSFSALAYANSGATAKASAAGTEASTDGGASDNAEKQTTDQLDANDTSANSQKNKDAVKGQVKTSQGNVSIAAGFSLNLVNSKANASLADGLVINANGKFQLAATNETDAAAI
ncbi:MAG: hypothetical protein NW214_16060, partial [Pseudanabaenaceae cyanobacterium bins.39]|nr:hypothetical protein [Pseudanabaenaceae cyanobacterium bins.39]